MKFKAISIIGVASLALVMSACPAATNTNNATNSTTNNANKPAANNSNTANNAANTATNNTASNNTATSSADGQEIKIDEAGITMIVPKGFKFSKDGEDTIVQTEDEGVDVRFSVPKDGDYAKTINDAVKEMGDYLTDIKVTDEGSPVDVNGMKGTSLSGTAKNEGEDVMWDLTIIDAPKKPVLANIYAAKSSMETHGKAVEAFFKSVKKQ